LARKRSAIVAAATEAFLSSGYSRTSMDDVARLAKVSKQTVYMHFGSKERLLSAIVMEIVTTTGDPLVDDLGRLGESTNLERDLRTHARHQLTGVLQQRPMQLRRLIISEAVTFPDLGRQFYELLNAPDPERAASDYNWLVMSDPLNRAMILGHAEPPTQKAINEWADQAVHTFLAAYT
jgi:TetR/AcrR family transcriptional regulator, mexJK operon transcriptional repressor